MLTRTRRRWWLSGVLLLAAGVALRGLMALTALFMVWLSEVGEVAVGTAWMYLIAILGSVCGLISILFYIGSPVLVIAGLIALFDGAMNAVSRRRR